MSEESAAQNTADSKHNHEHNQDHDQKYNPCDNSLLAQAGSDLTPAKRCRNILGLNYYQSDPATEKIRGWVKWVAAVSGYPVWLDVHHWYGKTCVKFVLAVAILFYCIVRIILDIVTFKHKFCKWLIGNFIAEQIQTMLLFCYAKCFLLSTMYSNSKSNENSDEQSNQVNTNRIYNNDNNNDNNNNSNTNSNNNNYDSDYTSLAKATENNDSFNSLKLRKEAASHSWRISHRIGTQNNYGVLGTPTLGDALLNGKVKKASNILEEHCNNYKRRRLQCEILLAVVMIAIPYVTGVVSTIVDNFVQDNVKGDTTRNIELSDIELLCEISDLLRYPSLSAMIMIFRIQYHSFSLEFDEKILVKYNMYDKMNG